MSMRPHSCPGCIYGGTHLQGCEEEKAARVKESGLPEPGACIPEFSQASRQAITQQQQLEPDIQQTIIPSSGTKLVCTQCGREDWHTLILRRRAGLLEGLCKQEDGSGCYPCSSRRNCSYTYPNQMDCPQVAEYVVSMGKDKLFERQVCRDHISQAIGEQSLYQVWAIND
jgi:hypothetical protein